MKPNPNLWAVKFTWNTDVIKNSETLWILAARASSADYKARRHLRANSAGRGFTITAITHEGSIDVF